ncbi:hypothetical protein A9Q99_15400 [Gammaproteobacteria bacterium 45_16_T64]|nr:hypothetical protein A9Q99_15400 [Gammaproteobacteria bacterium 45_16_T64]
MTTNNNKIKIMEDLKQHPLFNATAILTDPQLNTLRKRAFNHGDVIYQPGDTPEYVYLITQGSIKFEFTTSSGQEVFVEHVTKGFIVGELEILSGFSYQSIAIAKQATQLILIPKNTLLHFMQSHPDFSLKFSKQLATNFFLYQALSAERERSNLKTKIANSLMSLGLRFGLRTEKGISIKISHSELSDMINASRQRVNMQLKDWENSHILYCQYGEIIIKNMDALQQYTHVLTELINEQSLTPYT